MKKALKWMTAFSILLPVTWLQTTAFGYDTADLQRLQWLCRDYQIPVQGYVVEGWFQLGNMPGMEHFLQEKLEIQDGFHRQELSDGSILTTIMQRKNKTWSIELQLIAKTSEQATRYYKQWQRFSNFYCPENPVGITVIAAFPEAIDIAGVDEIVREIADGLGLETIAQISDTQYLQLSGYTEQLLHKLCVNGTKINSSITIVPEEDRTCLYIASPLLYQQI